MSRILPVSCHNYNDLVQLTKGRGTPHKLCISFNSDFRVRQVDPLLESPANDHLIEFHLVEIVFFHLIEISLIT